MSKAMSMCDMHFDTTPVASHAVQDGASSPMPDVAAESDAVARGPERRNAHHLSLMSHLSVCGARRIPNRLRVSYVRILLRCKLPARRLFVAMSIGWVQDRP